ncbi:MAG TPA: hypothetical protein V6C97_15865, partial [Oculatellaceae cyanobacterium]
VVTEEQLSEVKLRNNLRQHCLKIDWIGLYVKRNSWRKSNPDRAFQVLSQTTSKVLHWIGLDWIG